MQGENGQESKQLEETDPLYLNFTSERNTYPQIQPFSRLASIFTVRAEVEYRIEGTTVLVDTRVENQGGEVASEVWRGGNTPFNST